MRQQMTVDGMLLLSGGLILFWICIGVLVRRHARRPFRRRNRDTQVEPQT